MNKILATLAVLLCTCSFSQQEINTSSVAIAEDVTQSTNWTNYVETSELKIEYFISDCFPNSGLDFQTVFLRMTNLTGNTIDLSWHIDVDFGGVCIYFFCRLGKTR